MLKDNFITEPPVPVIELAKRQGLDVVFVEHDAFDNVSGFIDFDSREIVVNAKESIGRQAFTIAHEIGHWVLHREKLEANKELSIVYRRAIAADKEPIEQEANAFAAELLVPREMLRAYFGVPSSIVAKAFGVSEDVVGYRRSLEKSYWE